MITSANWQFILPKLDSLLDYILGTINLEFYRNCNNLLVQRMNLAKERQV
jgi:hypothetical protein